MKEGEMWADIYSTIFASAILRVWEGVIEMQRKKKGQMRMVRERLSEEIIVEKWAEDQ